ncbi:hypothetical protein AS850_02070 [Frondihabitans sp. 762G35]|uniref:hypothetical protein n=1 Tax=Frondihabitans sp. 762G35 TaxID=1446794 RepID=UPI000D225309|nr:hypothetical protein [Frondihabitans sp. 762G35]ARC55865.1 hypothetical protein AS850_02070 [Frondihabitans sp. 762G35]
MIVWPFRVAWAATWRVTLALSGLLAVTVVPVGLLFGALGGRAAAGPVLAFAVLLPGSVLVHEWAHAACAWRWAACRTRREVVPVGGWRRAGVRRPRLPVRFDVATTVAGPLAGAASGLLLFAAVPGAGSSALLCGALCLPFAAHLLSLAPSAADGRALLAALAPEGSTP